jgi:N-[(2S)-2-amino-2-carboxyethyl]-L-glutamate dehydrogenase
MNPQAACEQLPFSVITGRTISRIIFGDVEGCMNVVREAYLAHADGRSSNPQSVFLRFPDRPNARIIALPTHLSTPGPVSGIKWIASYPDNVSKGLARASAVIILNSHEHGYPFACLEGSIISAARTAASAVLAAASLHGSRRVKALGIVGTGVISRYIYRFLTDTGWEIETVQLHDLSAERAQAFAATACEPARHREVAVQPEIADVLRQSDLVVFATVAQQPHVFDRALFSHCPLVLHVSLRDLAPEILLSSWNIVDDINHVMQAETSPHLAEKLAGHSTFITGTLADVMSGQRSVDRSRPVIFSPFGLGVLDLSLGKWVYDCARADNDGVPIDEFFYDACSPRLRSVCNAG